MSPVLKGVIASGDPIISNGLLAKVDFRFFLRLLGVGSAAFLGDSGAVGGGLGHVTGQFSRVLHDEATVSTSAIPNNSVKLRIILWIWTVLLKYIELYRFVDLFTSIKNRTYSARGI